MYGKLFVQMYDGTLAKQGPWQAMVTFQQLIILADRNGTVDMTADAISRRTTIPLAIIELGLTALQQPDPESRSPDEAGRRIVLLDPGRSWGWQIVNYGHYRKIRNEEERRAYRRDWIRDKRAQERAQSEQVSTMSTNSSKQEAVGSKQKHKKALGLSAAADEPFALIWKAYPTRPNNSKAKARKAYLARLAEGVEPTTLLEAVNRYAAFCRREKTEPRFIKQAATFLGPDRHWESDYTSTPTKAPQAVYAPYHEKYKPPQREIMDERVQSLVGSIGSVPGASRP